MHLHHLKVALLIAEIISLIQLHIMFLVWLLINIMLTL